MTVHFSIAASGRDHKTVLQKHPESLEEKSAETECARQVFSYDCNIYDSMHDNAATAFSRHDRQNMGEKKGKASNPHCLLNHRSILQMVIEKRSLRTVSAGHTLPVLQERRDRTS